MLTASAVHMRSALWRQSERWQAPTCALTVGSPPETPREMKVVQAAWSPALLTVMASAVQPSWLKEQVWTEQVPTSASVVMVSPLVDVGPPGWQAGVTWPTLLRTSPPVQVGQAHLTGADVRLGCALVTDHDGAAGWTTPGQSCLAVPVPVLEEWVASRTAHYDPSFLSPDPHFAQAHLTLLAPWVAAPVPEDLDAVAAVLAQVPVFDVVLARVAVFPDGLVHAVPEPDAGLRSLTRRLAAAFPDHPPYGGRYDATGGPVPHVTLDRLGPDVTEEWVRAEVADLLPARLVVDRVDLQWWGNHACRRMHSWRLGA